MGKSYFPSAFGYLLISFLLIFLVYYLGYVVERSHFSCLLPAYFIFFLLYLGICFFSEAWNTVLFFLILAIFLRFLLLFSLPNLSDDFFRFIWDGRLINQGINPFDHLPSYYLQNNRQIPGIDTLLYEQLNSPDYFTIYPPLNQAIFALAAWISPNDITESSMVMKSFLFVFEVGNILLIISLLRQFRQKVKKVLLYALNPLIIIETSGNLHFEGGMIFFLLLSIWLLVHKEKLLLSAIAFSFSVCTKLLPLMFLPLWIRRLKKSKEISVGHNTIKKKLLQQWENIDRRRVIIYFFSLGMVTLLLFLPLINQLFLENLGSSLNYYFQKFEFNASLYYIFRWIGYQLKGYNVINTLGPLLALSAFSGILLLAFLEKKPDWQNLFEKMLFVICIYLFSATTVHPWYISLPLVCSIFTSFRFPVLWSGLVFLTYINYSYSPYYENLKMVAIEYLMVTGFMLFELRQHSKVLKVSTDQ